ncbi:MAG: enoyl-CoA hydratase-related protein [Acidothermaceae bacterium]
MPETESGVRVDKSDLAGAGGGGATAAEGGGAGNGGGVATVTIERARGVLDTETKITLRAVLEDLAEDPAVRAVVLTGSGAAFCAGQDLRTHSVALGEDPAAAWNTLRDHYNPIVTALATMPKPVIAAVNGVAAGAGASFAFACDLRLMADSASFHVAFGAIGLSVDSGMSWTLPRLVGYARAVDLLLRPRPITAAAALSLGLAHEVMPGATLAARAAALAAQLATGPTVAFGAMKQALAFSAGHGLAESLDHEAQLQRRAGTTADHADAVRAFLDKQPPTFNGR